MTRLVGHNLFGRHLLMDVQALAFCKFLILLHTVFVVELKLLLLELALCSPIFQISIQKFHLLQSLHLCILSTLCQIIEEFRLFVLHSIGFALGIHLCAHNCLRAFKILVELLVLEFFLFTNKVQLVKQLFHLKTLQAFCTNLLCLYLATQLHQSDCLSALIETFFDLMSDNVNLLST